jgi:uncharacterized protein YcbK (DUF882 family)
MLRLASPLVAAACAALVTAPSSVDLPVARADGLAEKKSHGAAAGAPPLATLVQTHSDERVVLDEHGPPLERFSALLRDRVTGEEKDLDPKLLDLLRAVAKKHAEAGPPRIELVSGYRSAKRNEMMRKKGHHVASHSQHSLGHAVDFRVVLPGADKGIDPRVLEQEIRDLGWVGGVGVYTQSGDWFVHCDVGNNRRWSG